MKTKLKWAGVAVAILPILWFASFLQYYLPSTTKVQLTGTEVKRMDAGDPDGFNENTRDVRFIITRDIESGRTRVFRNEDTRWGWPPYFKFDSGDLAGDAQNIRETQPKATVLITYYGWRVTMFDLYPNATDVEIVDPDYMHVPVFNLVFLTLMFGGTGFTMYRIRRWFRRRRQKKEAALGKKGEPLLDGKVSTDPNGAASDDAPSDAPTDTTDTTAADTVES